MKCLGAKIQKNARNSTKYEARFKNLTNRQPILSQVASKRDWKIIPGPHCEEPLPGLNHIKVGTLTEDPTSGWRSFWERSQFSSWLSTTVLRNALETVAEIVCFCGFRRISSKLDRAPKMRDFVLLNNWDNFSVTLPSFSTETCGKYSSLTLREDVSLDSSFLGCYSCVSLATAANFPLFLNVTIIWR